MHYNYVGNIELHILKLTNNTISWINLYLYNTV